MSERTEQKYKDEDINLTLHGEISVIFRKSDIDSLSKKRNKTLVIFVKKKINETEKKILTIVNHFAEISYM